MIFDNHRIEIAYVFLVFIAWIWAVSQIKRAINRGGWTWSNTTAAWMTAKASFFTVAAWAWWFNWFNALVFEIAIHVLTVAHIVAFVHWLRLKPAEKAPPVEAMVDEPRERSPT